MKTLSFGFLTMAVAISIYASGCSSSNGGGAGGSTGKGGSTGAGGTTTITDAHADTPADAPGDTNAAPTFGDVFAIISSSVDNSPGCAHCHDGLVPGSDAGATALPHLLNFTNKATAYGQLVGVTSIRCAGADGGTAVMRIAAGNPAGSVLVQKISQGLGIGSACDGVGMPLQVRVPADAGGGDAGDAGDGGTPVDAGFVQATHYAVTATQLQTIVAWVNAGAPNN